MPPKKSQTPEGNRTTSQNVWQPPPTDGTTSPQRAARWQGTSQDEAPPGSAGKKEVKIADEAGGGDDTRSATSGSTNRSKSSKASSKKKKGVEEEAPPVDKGPKMPQDVDWFGDPLNPGIDASLGPGGCLLSFTKKNGTRAGMCNPPMNPVVRAALLADLNAFGTTPVVKTKKEKDAEIAVIQARHKEETVKAKQSMSPSEQMKAYKEKLAKDKARAEAQADLLPDAGFMAAMGMNQSAPSFHGGGSQGSSRMSTATGMPANRQSTLKPHSHGHRASSPFSKTRKKKKDNVGKSFQLDDVDKDGVRKKPALETAPEGEFKHRTFALKRLGRQHGELLEKMCVKEAGELRMYHNIMSRGPLQHAPISVNPIHPSRQLKDIGGSLMSTSKSLPNYSLDAAALLIPRPPVFTNQYNLGKETGAPSMERLLEMANSVMHSTPHELQRMCEVANTSVHTATQVRQGWDSMGGSQMMNTRMSEDDPLFSSRLGSTPRTSTGKPLPVPYWGKNGNAPALRQPPELRQARSQG